MLTHRHPKSAQKKGKNDKGRNTEWKENRKKTERKRKERKNDKADKVVEERIRVATNYEMKNYWKQDLRQKSDFKFLKKKQLLTEKVVLLKFILGNFWVRFFGCNNFISCFRFLELIDKNKAKTIWMLFLELTIIICYNVFTEKVHYWHFLIMRSYVNFFQSNDANFVVLQMKLIWKRKSEQTCHKKRKSPTKSDLINIFNNKKWREKTKKVLKKVFPEIERRCYM